MDTITGIVDSYSDNFTLASKLRLLELIEDLGNLDVVKQFTAQVDIVLIVGDRLARVSIKPDIITRLIRVQSNPDDLFDWDNAV